MRIITRAPNCTSLRIVIAQIRANLESKYIPGNAFTLSEKFIADYVIWIEKRIASREPITDDEIKFPCVLQLARRLLLEPVSGRRSIVAHALYVQAVAIDRSPKHCHRQCILTLYARMRTIAETVGNPDLLPDVAEYMTRTDIK